MMRRVLGRTTAGMAVAAIASSRRCVSDAQTVRKPHTYEQFLQEANVEYVEELLSIWRKDKTAVDTAWWPILESLETNSTPPELPIVKFFSRPKGGSPVSEADEARIDAVKFAFLVRSYEQKGHLIADLDPLGMFDADLSDYLPPELQPQYFGFGDADMDKTFRVARSPNVIGSYTDGPNTVSLRSVVEELKATYCGYIGYEFAHLRSVEEQNFLRALVLEPPAPALDHTRLHETLHEAEAFERLFHAKFGTAKRFGSEGGEAKIAMLQVMLDELAGSGIENAIFSMAHRGRLSILHNVLGKDIGLILNEFQGLASPDNKNNLGDVKYHLGHQANIKTIHGKKMHVRMLANPSHLECVAPVSQGVVRAMQLGKERTAHIVLHGDAAFAGQGVSFETVAMAELEKFSVNGTIHVITNNQVGFTTNPAQSRSAAYCTDLAKLNNCPVFHVNADKPESVIRVAQIASRYRAQFKKDVIIDFVCYRRKGHNEMDEPRFTQPLMYRAIDKHDSVSTIYSKALMESHKLTQKQYEDTKQKMDGHFRNKFSAWEKDVSEGKYIKKVWYDPVVAEYAATEERTKAQSTGVDQAKLQELGAHCCALPEGFQPHSIIAPIIKKRAQSYAEGKEIEWASAEQLALASLISEGHGVRLSGQDVERGTFSQRHFNLHDFNNGDEHNALNSVPGARAPVSIGNSLLSEFGVAGFEMGYSMVRLNDIVMWEAQFGDFSNGAQIIWDNFLSGCEVKWGDKCNLIVSLPHGYDGQGPEHSSGRLERFLQLEGSDDAVPADFPMKGVSAYHANEARIFNTNWQVTFPTTAANYFHLLRRQVTRDFQKPLINFFSKSNLRATESKSNIEELATGTQFQPVIDQDISSARRVVFCSGQVANLLRRSQAEKKVDDVAIVRIEQIAPFPWESVAEVMTKYRSANKKVEFVWVQDEPRNMGAWAYVRPRFRNLLVHMGVPLKEAAEMRYIGREANGSPATGYDYVHKAEEKFISEKPFE